MLEWLSANLLNIGIISGILIFVFFQIRSSAKRRKSGKYSCGCDCANCGLCDIRAYSKQSSRENP